MTRTALLAAAALLAASAPAPGDATLRAAPGDLVRGHLAPDGEDTVLLEGVAGTRITLDLRASFEPEMDLLGPGLDEVADSGDFRESGRRVLLRGFVLPETGTYAVVIGSHGGGDDGEGGAWTLDTRVAAGRGRRFVVEGDDSAAPVDLGVLPGGSDLRLRVRGGVLLSLQGPGGDLLPGGVRAWRGLLPSTGAWSALVLPDREDRDARLSAAVRIPRVPGAEREVVPSFPAAIDDAVGRTVLVRLRDGADEAEFEARHGCDAEEGVGGTGFVRVAVPEGQEVEEFLASLGADADVLEREANLLSEAPEGDPSNLPFTSSEAARIDVQNQQAFALVGVGEAQASSTGAGVIVAVLDTGVLPAHPDLAGRLLSGWDFVDGDADPTDAGNGLDDDGDLLVDEGLGHGTFVAGLLAVMAPDCSILPVRVLDGDARGTSEGVARGIVWAVDHGARILNLSLGVRQPAGVLQDALNYARAAEVLVVASAGNASLADAVSFPASLSEVLTVTAVDGSGVRAPFANVASRVDLAAPGVGVLAPHVAGGYATWSGTSFAAPFAAGGAALVLGKSPGLRARDAGRRLLDTAVPVDSQNPAVAGRLGRGRIAVAAALRGK